METNPQSVSSTRKQIAAALVKAQRDFGPALKTNTNPHFRSKYAGLDACVEAVIDALNKHGIALTQQTEPTERGVIVETVLVHESGEEMSFGKLFVPCTKNDAQGFGSAITYARRYQLQTALGLAPEDDDGNAASQRIIAKDHVKGTTTYQKGVVASDFADGSDIRKAKAKHSPHPEDDDRIPF